MTSTRGLEWSRLVAVGVLSLAAVFSGAAADAVAPAAFPGSVRLSLPPRLYAVPGVEMNVYFDNICLAVNPANYAFDADCAKGRQQAERWTFVASEADVGRYPFAVEVRDGANGLVARAESVLEVVSAKAGAGLPVSVLTIGDSLTHAAVYPERLLALCASNENPRVTLVGHVPNASNPDVRIEGYGGWTAQRFATFYREGPRIEGDWKAWNANGSPFLYAGSAGKPELDFARYCREFNGGKAPDFVTILLGCNDIFGARDDTIDATVDALFAHYDKLVDMVRRFGPETRIGVMLITPPAGTQDAFGANYACTLTRWQFKRNQARVVERLVEKYGGREAEGISLVPVNVNLDCAHNYPSVKAPANAQTQAEAVRLSNGVHPSAEGYRQIGDTLYCWLKARLAAHP